MKHNFFKKMITSFLLECNLNVTVSEVSRVEFIEGRKVQALLM